MTTGDYMQARIKNLKAKRINDLLKENEALIITGFQGITEDDEIKTLGRGGSDTSAVALAAAECQVRNLQRCCRNLYNRSQTSPGCKKIKVYYL